MAPSVRATIEFNASYPHSSFMHTSQYPLMGIYTVYPKINIEKNCSQIWYGQLRNENLHPHLKVGKYRTTTCIISGSDTVKCRGRVNIQDYIPRKFHLTFGFHCGWQPVNSLKGLTYNISFYNLSNKTNNCLNVPGKCSELYIETSLPNLIGNEKAEEITNFENALRAFEVLAFQHDTCYQHMWEFMCHTVLPKCDPITKQVIHPCREMSFDFANGCWKKIVDFAHARRPYLDISNIYSLDIYTLSNCGYLPPSNGNIPCFYKPVTCNSLPEVTNGTRILNSTQRDVYQLHDVLYYACVNETFEKRGLYSGQWSHLPPICVPVKKVKNPEMNLVYITLPVFLIFLIVVIVVALKCKVKSSPEIKEERIKSDAILTQLTGNNVPLLPIKRKQESTLSLDSLPSLKRNRKFDTFVLYHFDTDNAFVINSLIPELEETNHLSLNIHSRNFQPGRNIDENIEDAIESSNNAIILMSSGFTSSRWCADEFTHCYIEHIEDPSFKLFIIMMESVRDLPDLTPNMKKLFAEQTYLEGDDPELFTKLARYLRPEKDNDANDNEEF